ncbi:MAG: outer membrane protein [Candidatus Sumerlaeota bacterium]|nr:outer membrane protein [Candidatus Sumerlaeota bacterium]
MKPIRRTTPVILSLALLMLSGCAVLSPTNPYRPVTPRLHFETHGNEPSPQIAAAPEDFGDLGLSEAIAIALGNNPEVAATGFDAMAAQARKAGAWGAMLPSLSAEGAYTRHLDDQRLLPARYNGESGVFSDTIYSADLVVRMPLFAGGRLINEARAAKLLSQAAQHRLGRTREELVFNVTSVFYSILAQEQLIESLVFSREALDSHLKRINDLIGAQKAAKVDRLRTEVRLADVQQKIVAERNTLAIQKQLLANLMGVEETSRSLMLQGTLDESTTRSLSQEEGVAVALTNRPDYLAARRELEAQAKRVDVARGAYSPTVGLFGAYGGRWASDSTEQWDAGGQVLSGSNSEDAGRVGIGIEIPLFQGGRIRARVKEEHAKLAAAQERLHKLELQIRLEVETAILNFSSASERVQMLRKSVEQAEESLRIERQKYELGKGAIVDVLDAQAALLEAETNYYRALAEVHIARAQIELATGETTE